MLTRVRVDGLGNLDQVPVYACEADADFVRINVRRHGPAVVWWPTVGYVFAYPGAQGFSSESGVWEMDARMFALQAAPFEKFSAFAQSALAKRLVRRSHNFGLFFDAGVTRREFKRALNAVSRDVTLDLKVVCDDRKFQKAVRDSIALKKPYPPFGACLAMHTTGQTPKRVPIIEALKDKHLAGLVAAREVVVENGFVLIPDGTFCERDDDAMRVDSGTVTVTFQAPYSGAIDVSFAVQAAMELMIYDSCDADDTGPRKRAKTDPKPFDPERFEETKQAFWAMGFTTFAAKAILDGLFLIVSRPVDVYTAGGDRVFPDTRLSIGDALVAVVCAQSQVFFDVATRSMAAPLEAGRKKAIADLDAVCDEYDMKPEDVRTLASAQKHACSSVGNNPSTFDLDVVTIEELPPCMRHADMTHFKRVDLANVVVSAGVIPSDDALSQLVAPKKPIENAARTTQKRRREFHNHVRASVLKARAGKKQNVASCHQRQNAEAGTFPYVQCPPHFCATGCAESMGVSKELSAVGCGISPVHIVSARRAIKYDD